MAHSTASITFKAHGKPDKTHKFTLATEADAKRLRGVFYSFMGGLSVSASSGGGNTAVTITAVEQVGGGKPRVSTNEFPDATDADIAMIEQTLPALVAQFGTP